MSNATLSARRVGPVLGGIAVLAVAAALGTAGGVARASGAGRPAVTQSWPVAGQNLSDTHDQAAETAISAGNVSTLVPKWTLTTAGDVTATPTVQDGTVYVPDMGGMLWAVNATTGAVVWSDKVSGYTGIAGDVSRTSPAITGNELITGDGWASNTLTAGAHVFAVNRTTGAKLWSVSVDSNPASIITGSPVVSNGVAYVGVSSKEESLAAHSTYKCCTFRGKIVALNVATGKILWKAYMVPSNNGGGDSNVPGYYTGNAVWGSAPVVDPATGLLYVGTGNNYSVPKGVCFQPGQKMCKKPIATDYFDSILALKLSTGAVAWDDRTIEGDVSVNKCKICGPDYDFGSSPNLFTVTNPATHASSQLLGIGQKSGIYWAVNPSSGAVAWHTQVGPGGGDGGIEWGSAADGSHVYSAEANSDKVTYTLGGSGPFSGQKTTAGSWAALNPATGKMLWQTPDPQGQEDPGYVTTANGVVYAGSNAPTGNNMYALSASTGAVLWSFASGGSVRSGAAVVGSQVYWGSGYGSGPNDKLYAFGLS
jgi:polyvinyl alcohol dehydrogenase (cytochrome)